MNKYYKFVKKSSWHKIQQDRNQKSIWINKQTDLYKQHIDFQRIHITNKVVNNWTAYKQ